MKTVKLMADYGCFALWDEDSVDNISPDELPISNSLRFRVHRWEEEFDATLNTQDPASSGFSSEAELRRFDQEGFDLCQCLRHELGIEYAVLYFSPLRRAVIEP
jgi:hypothetical protein